MKIKKIYTWPSPAKINLFLYITGIRKDKYHNIQTLFQFINYGDTLKIVPNKTGSIKLFTQEKYLLNKQNSIITAAKLLKKKGLIYKRIFNTYNGAKIFLKKKIPIGSGLGGGSSNAATTLIVLNKLWNTQFTLQELSLFGLEIGSDVPGFIMGHTAIIEGIGDILYPIKKKEKWYVVVYPYIHISTKKMFLNPLLTKYHSKKSIQELLNAPFNNDFEDIAKKTFIKIKKLLAILSSYAHFRMTGTGSCIFSEFNDKNSAEKIFKLIPKNMKSFVAKSLNISPLHEMIYKE
ncbi:4-(cytidine 5'-diphospho)-2-C-methyl-D-erythritol kinase [Buchnera aphidicola (Macrosiphoniella sanborni)]|uniref:4-diphosphocytidyl-2-C-methyl-D-erythritol kinase n=1 Tax=Buchnera aphidicola (Macrosiphoniella sanborni) TaxID=1241865 RepID=A0A4D6YHB0_9GAMM|nr:4-(cytidine 5'-diphospho)-2-C-methyl-D-erythritol kinase [Buchnera aphidicola]QCI23725.1 4-(cytidine 5'-diphospho)-2-C-methyl-D-erythritol kinase [Buchnera aphidicola (Macrosiphoniella sanborni)]